MRTYKEIVKNYILIFIKACNAKGGYNSTTKKITLTQNGVSISMTVGSKTAYQNGIKFKLPVAPSKVTYVKNKKTKILVPVKCLSALLKYGYSENQKTGKVLLTTPFPIQYDGKVSYYLGYKGKLSVNSKVVALTDMPMISIGGGTLASAKEIFKDYFKMKYDFDEKTKQITIVNPNNDNKLILTVNSPIAYLNGVKVTTKVVPRQIKRLDTNKTIVCVPTNFTATQLGYLYRWNKSTKVAIIHKKSYFSWISQNTLYDTTVYLNKIKNVDSTYDITRNAIIINLTGNNASIMSKVTFVRKDTTITITIPTTYMDLDHSSFSEFGEIIKSSQIKQVGVNTIITLVGYSALDYAYVTNNASTTIQLFGSYVGAYQIKIPKPKGVTFDQVTNTDFYDSKRFKIYVKGDYVDYFKTNPIAINSNLVKSVSVAKTAKGNTAITISTTILQGYKIYDKSDSFGVYMDIPQKIYRNIVVLDAGHGGTDPGAVANNTYEKNLNFKMMYTLMKPYFSSNAPTIKAYWTRSTDTFITLSNRAGFAKKMGADLFISLHMNCWTKSSVNGSEVYYSSSNNTPNSSGLTSKTMASLILKNITATMGTINRGISAQKYTVVHKNTVPAVLIELGFLSGSSDFLKISNETYQKKATKTIYDSIVQIFSQYPTGR